MKPILAMSVGKDLRRHIEWSFILDISGLVAIISLYHGGSNSFVN